MIRGGKKFWSGVVHQMGEIALVSVTLGSALSSAVSNVTQLPLDFKGARIPKACTTEAAQPSLYLQALSKNLSRVNPEKTELARVYRYGGKKRDASKRTSSRAIAFISPQFQSWKRKVHQREEGYADASTDPSFAPRPLEQKLAQYLLGFRIAANDPVLNSVREMLNAGRRGEAVSVLLEDRRFVDVMIRNWGSFFLSTLDTPLPSLSEDLGTLIGLVRDDADARKLLTGSALYKFKDSGIQKLVESGELPASYFLTSAALPDDFSSTGILSASGFGSTTLFAGTNRLPMKGIFRVFMCAPEMSWKTAYLPDDRVRKDIPRFPAGDAFQYQTDCRSCHAPMDGMAGAFALWDSKDKINGPVESTFGPIVRKMNNPGLEGRTTYTTTDTSWINYLATETENPFGFDASNAHGVGVASLANHFAESRGFRDCMARRVFEAVCEIPIDQFTDPDADDIQEINPLLNRLSTQFAQKGYSFKSLFKEVALSPECGLFPKK